MCLSLSLCSSLPARLAWFSWQVASRWLGLLLGALTYSEEEAASDPKGRALGNLVPLPHGLLLFRAASSPDSGGGRWAPVEAVFSLPPGNLVQVAAVG